MSKTIFDLAAAMSARFQKCTRDAGKGETYYSIRPESPKWMQDVCREAHQDGSPGPFGGMLPDDHRYQMIFDAVVALESEESIDDARDSLEPPVYTHEILAWVSSRNDRVEYCDRAREEGMWSPDTTQSLLALGYWMEQTEVFDNVVSAIESVAEDWDDDNDDDGTGK